MPYKNLDVVDLEPGIVQVTLNRPPVNAVDAGMYEEIRDLFRDLAESDARVVVLTGQGNVFCAGNDLHEFVQMTPENGDWHMRLAREAFYALYDCTIPVVASINGAALGTGFALATCCDLMIASENARFGLPEMNVGVLGGAKFGVRVLPELVMRRLFFTGDPISAEEFARYGALAEVVPAEKLQDRTLHYARRIAGKSPAALRLAKQALNGCEYLDLKRGYEFEQTFTVRMSGHPDSKEAVRAVLEKREPVFAAGGTA